MALYHKSILACCWINPPNVTLVTRCDQFGLWAYSADLTKTQPATSSVRNTKQDKQYTSSGKHQYWSAQNRFRKTMQTLSSAKNTGNRGKKTNEVKFVDLLILMKKMSVEGKVRRFRSSTMHGWHARARNKHYACCIFTEIVLLYLKVK